MPHVSWAPLDSRPFHARPLDQLQKIKLSNDKESVIRLELFVMSREYRRAESELVLENTILFNLGTLLTMTSTETCGDIFISVYLRW